jgi:hypothetical protein
MVNGETAKTVFHTARYGANRGAMMPRYSHRQISVAKISKPALITMKTAAPRCSGLHLKSAQLAISAVSRSIYLQLTDGVGSDCLQASSHLSAPARIPSGPAHAL